MGNFSYRDASIFAARHHHSVAELRILKRGKHVNLDQINERKTWYLVRILKEKHDRTSDQFTNESYFEVEAEVKYCFTVVDEGVHLDKF